MKRILCPLPSPWPIIEVKEGRGERERILTRLVLCKDDLFNFKNISFFFVREVIYDLQGLLVINHFMIIFCSTVFLGFIISFLRPVGS